MKFNISLFIIFISLLFIGCEKSLYDEKRVANEREIEQYLSRKRLSYTKEKGVYHAVLKPGFGYKINAGDEISFWYAGYKLSGLVFDTNITEIAFEAGLDLTARQFNPIFTTAGAESILEGVRRGLLMCRGNEKAAILFPSSLGFGKDYVGPIDPWTPLAYDIFIINVKNQHIEQEQNIISNFVANSQGFSLDTVGFFVKYINEIESTIQPTHNDTIYGWYKGSILNGQDYIELPLQGEMIILNKDHLIEGLMYSFMRMNPGEEIEVIIPSSIGHGIKEYNSIPPYTPLIYQLRLDSIKH
jgi:FKBP-type peptidyl-prolyl cis-trans isomerase